jgi:hypothetical protein
MVTGVKQTDEKLQVKRYKIQHSIDEYTFPEDAYIHAVRFDEKYIQIELIDQRVLSIPLWWIPTIYNASAVDRERFEISQNRKMIIWDPNKCKINDEINILDYLGPTREEVGAAYKPREPKRKIAEGKIKRKK